MSAPDIFARDSRADRFKMLMRSPGRTRTVESANVVVIETDEDERRFRSNVSAACKIMGVTSSIERSGDVYRVTLLEIR